MTTLAESFLADLEDLSDGEHERAEGDGVVDEEEVDELEEMEDIERLNYDELQSVAKLTSTPQYQDVMQRITDSLAAKPSDDKTDGTTLLEEDPTYKLLIDCNKLAVDIDNEIAIVHNFIRDKFRLQFPELESLVHHPIDYARVVKRIGNVTDLTLIDLEDILPAATVMVVAVTATTTSGKPLSNENLMHVTEACDLALQLDDDKRLILQLVESRMHHIAPNLSTVVGSEVAARLMGVAGGLAALSKMPACNIQVLGAKKKTLAGFSSATVQPHQGFIYASTIIQQTPPALRSRASRLVAGKCTLLARMDAFADSPTGEIGQTFREDILHKIEKWQEPPPAKQAKPLAAPDAEQKKRRGGRRLRRLKERYGMTEMRKAANRMTFNQPEEEYIDGEDVVGLGMLGKEGSGRLRIVASQQKMKLNAKTAKKFKQRNYGSSGATSGLSSSLAFTPVQGIELENPSAQIGADMDKRSGTESYFSEFGGFRSIQQ